MAVPTHLRNEVLRLLGYEPPGFRTISQKGYGDPVQNPTLQPYREITITRTPNATNGTESTREITRDRDTSGSLVITSDLSATYGFYKHGDPVKLAETQHTGTGSELTRTWTYYTAAADPASFNKPATLRRSDSLGSVRAFKHLDLLELGF